MTRTGGDPTDFALAQQDDVPVHREDFSTSIQMQQCKPSGWRPKIMHSGDSLLTAIAALG